MAQGRRRTRSTQKWTWARIGIGVGVGMILGAVFVGVWLGTRHESVTITDVSVSGGETVSHKVVYNLVQEELQGTYFFLIPYRFAYLYPERAIRQEVHALSRVSRVTIERTSQNSIHVHIEEYEPQALWCARASSSQCLLIDAHGYAFDTTPSIAGKTMLRYVDEVRSPVVGEYVFNREDIVGTQEFADVLEQRHGMRVTYIERTQAGDVKYHIADGGYILVASDVAIENTFDSLDAVLSSPDFAHVAPGNFQYIDVRFDGTVYIKDSEQETLEAETATTSASTTAT